MSRRRQLTPLPAPRRTRRQPPPDAVLIPLGVAHLRYPGMSRSWFYGAAREGWLPGLVARPGRELVLRVAPFERWLRGEGEGEGGEAGETA